jgi:hypothetical protein
MFFFEKRIVRNHVRKSQTNNNESKEEEKKMNTRPLTHKKKIKKNETYECQYMYKSNKSNCEES